MGDSPMTAEPEKIGGFDKWEITNAFETLEKAREILADDKKVKAIRIYAAKRVKATEEVAAQLNLEKTVGKKLSAMYGEKKKNTHHKKSGGY